MRFAHIYTSSDEVLQDKIWIEIIQSMEFLYAQLAENLAEIEKKNQELSEAKEFTENVLESMADILLVVDKNGVIKRVNRAAIELLGYEKEELLGRSVDEIIWFKEEKKDVFRRYLLGKILKESKIHDFEISCISKKGEKIPMSLSFSLMKDSKKNTAGVIIVARDVRKIKQLLSTAKKAAEAERKKAQELKKAYNKLKSLQNQLIHSEKLACIGRLAAGVAHEINNPLTGILTFAYLLLSEMAEDNPRREDLKVIVEEAERCRTITQNLLEFARENQPKKKIVNINTIVEKTLSIVEKQASFQNIKIIKELDPNIPSLLLDLNQIEQVFMNIVLNAQEAMPQGGFLTVSSNLSKDGKFVEVKVTDTGCGIPEKNLEKIFEPFFTTKKAGKGTGLGLAISYGIIKNHGGDISVFSKEGRGTTVLIKLPLIKGSKK